MNSSKFFQIFSLIVCATAFVGCVTPPPSGYYNPPATGFDHTAGHNLAFNGQFNGEPVAVTQTNQPQYYSNGRDQSVRDQQDWYKIAQRQQAQDHREALDRAKQTQRERDAQMRRVNSGIRSAERIMRSVERFGR